MKFPGLQGVKKDIFKNTMESTGLQGIKMYVLKCDGMLRSARC